MERGLVARAANPDDRRVVLQRPTRRGTALLSRLDKELTVVHTAIAEGLGARRLKSMIEGAERLAEVARGMNGSDDGAAASGRDG